jgi:ATP-dependent DNA helicase RecQ
LRLNKLKALVHLVTNTTTCINRMILEYFDEETDRDCGHCSNCKKIVARTTSEQILIALKKQPLDSQEICKEIKEVKDVVVAHLKTLLEQRKVILTSHNKYKINE